MIGSYSKVYNVGHRAVLDVFKEEVLVEEKIDGSQFSFGLIGGKLQCRSRNQQIDLDIPAGMFVKAVETVKKLDLTPGYIYRGEYLSKPKHNTVAYSRVPKDYIIIYDIDIDGGQNYLSYEEKRKEVERIGLEIVPLLFEGKVESLEDFNRFLETDSILGGSKIEGMVFKNYNRFNPDGKTLMAKHVSEKFKEANDKSWKKTRDKNIIQEMIDSYKTEARWNKAIQHLAEDGKLEYIPRDIGNLIKELQADFIEECREEIMARFWKIYQKRFCSSVVRGFPEYYKEYLIKRSFGE